MTGALQGLTLQGSFRPLIAAFIILLLLACSGCTGVSPRPGTGDNSQMSAAVRVDRIEVFHFHRNQQCDSCIAVGDLAEKTVNANFKDELASRRLVFAHVNAELPENADLAKKYGVTGSSLWIGVYYGSAFHKEENIRVWSLINNEEAYAAYLTGVITKRLNGDFS